MTACIASYPSRARHKMLVHPAPRVMRRQPDADLVVSSVITSVIMTAVGVLTCAAEPARRALRIQPTEALRQG